MPLTLHAQESAPDTVSGAWDVELLGRLAGSQAAYRHWTEGGVNSLASTAGLSAKAAHLSRNWQQNHDMRLAFGLVKQDTLAFRKAEDLIRINSSLQYRGDGFFKTFNPILALSVLTQFAPGYNYKKNPFTADTRPPPVKVSDMLSPATFTQSIGLTFKPSSWFTQRLGIATKETIVLIERFRTLYGLEPHTPIRVELGVESRMQVDRELFENVHLKSTLGLFAAFNEAQLPDLHWENLLAMRVNEWLGVNIEVVSLYDQDISNVIQLKEVLSLSISYMFI